MAAKYRKAASYMDRGVIHIHMERTEGPVDESIPFALMFQRPDKLRIEIDQVSAVLAGGKLHAALSGLPGQVVVRPTPAEVNLDALGRSRVLAQVLGEGFARRLVRLVLLLDDNAIQQLLEEAGEPELAEPGEIEGRACHRVRIRQQDQVATLWIDRETLIVRRIELPAGELIEGSGGTVQSASRAAEFVGAELDAQVPAEVFQFEIPEGAEVVKFFQPPSPADLLGKPAPDFQFSDLEGNPVNRESLAGKVTVLDFWGLNCGPCRISLPALSNIRQQYADNAKVAFYAVNIDAPQTENAELTKLFEELDVDIPILRDRQQGAFAAFRIPGVPTLFVLDGKGTVQHYAIGANPGLAQELPKTIETLLAGENTFEAQKKEYQEQLRKMEEAVDKAEASATESASEEPSVPEAQIAARSEPRSVRLKPLWTSTDVKEPGNLLAVPASDGQVKLVVVDGWKRIAELSLNGKLLALHEPKIESQELFNALRTGVAANGKRYYAAVALMSGQQRFHLFDQQFQLLLSFPANALKNPHSGIADVQLADLAGDGNLRVYVGYWGEVGVHAVSLTGERIWANRNVPNVQKMTVTGPDAEGNRRLLCANVTGMLAVMNAQGESAPPLVLGDRRIGWITSADLEGDGRMAYCGLVAETLGKNEAAGLAIDGSNARITWTYQLPDGVSRQPVQPIVAGRLTKDGSAQWLLPGPDGSIHILSADGEMLDRFNYGSAIQGLATVEIDGKPALLVATEKGVAAWAVE